MTLIRHAYVPTTHQRRGVGATMLGQLKAQTATPLLIGTWAAATWAIGFYERHGFRLVTMAEKDRLLSRYWSVPAAQAAASVVLADAAWRGRGGE